MLISSNISELQATKKALRASLPAFNLDVAVWPTAVRYTHWLDNAHTRFRRHPVEIDEATFKRIEAALDSMPTGWFQNARAIDEIRAIVPCPGYDEEPTITPAATFKGA